MRIDGRPNLRSCMTAAREGLRCERQNAFPSADVDILRAADWMFPNGMDHHTLMTGNRVVNDLFLKVVRQMGGSGTLPDGPPAVIPEATEEILDVCVVGAGPAGLASARAAAEATPGLRVALFDEQDAPGGSLHAEPGGTVRGAQMAEAAAKAGVRIHTSAAAIAFYAEDDDGVLAIITPAGLVRVKARRYVYATGAYDQNLPFRDNDRPGIVSARACGRLAFRYGVRPGVRVIVVGRSPYATTLAAGLRDARVETEIIDEDRERIVRARGVSAVRGIEVSASDSSDATTRVARADVVAVAALPAPASELPRQHGAAVTMDVERGGFVVMVNAASFASTVANVYACGDVTGYVGPGKALHQGATAGAAAAKGLA